MADTFAYEESSKLAIPSKVPLVPCDSDLAWKSQELAQTSESLESVSFKKSLESIPPQRTYEESIKVLNIGNEKLAPIAISSEVPLESCDSDPALEFQDSVQTSELLESASSLESNPLQKEAEEEALKSSEKNE